VDGWDDVLVTPPRRYRLDAGVQRFPGLLIGGSPLRLFRLTRAGDDVVDLITAGKEMEESSLVTALLDAGAVHPVAGETGPFGPGDVTIVVPTLGSPAHLPSRHDGPVVVVDDGSPDPVAAATIRLATNRGPAAARNAGVETATTPLVAFVDADVAVPSGWLDALLPHFADERVALVAPRVVGTDAPADGTPARLARHDATDGPLDLGCEPARIRAGTRVSYVPAAALVCRTDAIRAAGGFDESLRFGEDVDLVWRLDEAGWRCRYEPAVEVTHRPRSDWRSWVRQRVDYGSSAAPLSQRHPGALAPLRMNGWSLGAWGAAAAGHVLAGLAVGVGSAAALVPRLQGVPAEASLRLGLLGNLHAGDQLARAVRRTYWPLLVAGAVVSPAARRVLIASAVAARSPVRLADDVAYSIGVWRGIARTRTAAPLVPDVTAWPPRPRRRASGRSRSASPTPPGAAR
jgi:mycofactocin system glycosyltransferase